MKLIEFTIKNTDTTPKTPYSVRFSLRSNNAVNKSAAQLIGLLDGDRIVIAQDQHPPNEWYLSKGKGGWQVRENARGAMTYHTRSLSRSILSSLAIKVATATFFLSEDPIELNGKHYWLIKTDSYRTREKSEGNE